MNAVPEKANPQEQSYQPQSEKKSLVILLCTLFLLPIVFSPHNLVAPENVKIFFLSVFVLVSFFFLALAEFKKQRMQFYNHPLFFSALFTFAFLFLSAAFSKFPIASWTTSSGGYPFLVFFTLFTVLIASAYLSNTPSRSLYAVQIIVVSFLLTCIVTILQFFAYDFERFAFTPSFFGTWDDLAVFSGLVVLLSVSIFNFSTSLLARFLLLISFIFASLILFLTHQIPVLVILLVLLFLNLIMKKNSFPSTIALFLIALSLLAATVSISPLNLNRLSVSERLSEITNLPVARETFKEGPIRGLLGSGPNTALYQRDLYSFKTKPLQSWNTDFLTTWGLLPVFSFLIFLFLLFYSGTRVIFEKFSGTETKQNKIVITFFLPIAYLWILAFFYPMNITLLALTFFLTGISIAIYAYTKKGITFFFSFEFSFEQKIRKTLFIAVLGVILSVGVIGIFFYGKDTLSSAYFREAIAAKDEKAILNLTAKALSISQRDIYYRFLSAHYLGKLERLTESAVSAEVRNQIIIEYGTLAVRNAHMAIKTDERNYRNWSELGRIYLVLEQFGVEGSYGRGQEAYSRAQNLSPKNETLLLERAELAFLARDMHAQELLQELLRYNPDNQEALKRLREWNLNSPQ